MLLKVFNMAGKAKFDQTRSNNSGYRLFDVRPLFQAVLLYFKSSILRWFIKTLMIVFIIFLSLRFSVFVKSGGEAYLLGTSNDKSYCPASEKVTIRSLVSSSSNIL